MWKASAPLFYYFSAPLKTYREREREEEFLDANKHIKIHIIEIPEKQGGKQ